MWCLLRTAPYQCKHHYRNSANTNLTARWSCQYIKSLCYSLTLKELSLLKHYTEDQMSKIYFWKHSHNWLFVWHFSVLYWKPIYCVLLREIVYGSLLFRSKKCSVFQGCQWTGQCMGSNQNVLQPYLCNTMLSSLRHNGKLVEILIKCVLELCGIFSWDNTANLELFKIWKSSAVSFFLFCLQHTRCTGTKPFF